MKPFPRILGLFLSLTLAVPNPAFALREQPITEKKSSVLTGLKEALRSNNPAGQLLQLASAALTSTTVSPLAAPIATPPREFPIAAAGLEEEVDIRLKSFGITNRELLTGREVDTSRLQEQSWTMNGIRPEEKGPIFKDLDQIPLRKSTYPPEKLRRFSSGTSSDAVYLGFVDGISHPVVIKIFKSDAQAIHPAMKELVNAQIRDRLGVGARFYGVVELEDGRIGYALQLIPGEGLREPDAGTDFDEIFDRQHRAGLASSSFIRTPSGRLVAYDAGNTITFDDSLRSEFINSSAAGMEEGLTPEQAAEQFELLVWGITMPVTVKLQGFQSDIHFEQGETEVTFTPADPEDSGRWAVLRFLSSLPVEIAVRWHRDVDMEKGEAYLTLQHVKGLPRPTLMEEVRQHIIPGSRMVGAKLDNPLRPGQQTHPFYAFILGRDELPEIFNLDSFAGDEGLTGEMLMSLSPPGLLRFPEVFTQALREKEAGTIVGYSIYIRQEGTITIVDMGIHPDWRNHGVSGALIESLENKLKGYGFASLVVYVRESEADAQELFASHGFDPFEKVAGFFPDENAVLMVKNILHTQAPAAGAEEGMAPSAVEVFRGLFKGGDPKQMVQEPAVAARLQPGDRKTIKVELEKIGADVDSSRNYQSGRVFVQKGAVVPLLPLDIGELPRIEISDDPVVAARQFDEHDATAADLAFLAPAALEKSAEWNAVLQGRLAGIIVTREVVEALEQLVHRDPAYLAAFVSGARKGTGLIMILSIEVDEQTPGQRRLYLYA